MVLAMNVKYKVTRLNRDEGRIGRGIRGTLAKSFATFRLFASPVLTRESSTSSHDEQSCRRVQTGRNDVNWHPIVLLYTDRLLPINFRFYSS